MRAPRFERAGKKCEEQIKMAKVEGRALPQHLQRTEGKRGKRTKTAGASSQGSTHRQGPAAGIARLDKGQQRGKCAFDRPKAGQ